MKLTATLAALPLLLTPSLTRAQHKHINPPALPIPSGYTQVVTATGGTFVYISGQIGADAQGRMSPDFFKQTEQVFTNLKVALEAAGAKPQDILKLSYFVVGLDDNKLLAVRAMRDNLLGGVEPPASTLVGVQALFRPDCLIEVEAVAHIPAAQPPKAQPKK